MYGEGLGILAFLSVVIWTKMFDMVVSVIILAWSPVVPELVSILVVMHEPVFYVGWLGFFWLEVFVTNTNDVVLSVYIGVGGCLWTNYSTVVFSGIACRELIYSAMISSSSAEVIMFLKYLWDGQDLSVVCWVGCVVQHEKMSISSASRFWFGQVECIALCCYEHVTPTVGKYGVKVWWCVV